MTSRVETSIRSLVRWGVMSLAEFNRGRMRVPVRPDPFLSGIHAPMTSELEVLDLPVLGRIPPELTGRYLRIGPNAIRPDPRGHHWFVGDGMVHGLRLEGGRAQWYRNRWIRSNRVGEALSKPAAPGPRHSRSDTVNTALVQHAGALWALVEAGSTPVRLGSDLDSQAYDDFSGTLDGPFAAHPHRDPTTGELHAIAYEATEPNHVSHVVVDATGRVTRELRIPLRHGPMVHDCAITARYVLVFDLPVTFSMRTFVAGQLLPYRWNPNHPARLGLLPRKGDVGDIVWIPLQPCFIFHTVNAYDTDDGLVVLDAVVYDRMFDGVAGRPGNSLRALERWTIDPERRTVQRHCVDARPQEFPRIDERRSGRPHRYAYTLGLPAATSEAVVGASHIYKHDFATGQHWTHDFGPGKVPGEMVFVPRHSEADEDDGWLMGFVVDVPSEVTDFVVLDARDVEALPLASVRIPHRVPPGFHGCWAADEQ